MKCQGAVGTETARPEVKSAKKMKTLLLHEMTRCLERATHFLGAEGGHSLLKELSVAQSAQPSGVEKRANIRTRPYVERPVETMRSASRRCRSGAPPLPAARARRIRHHSSPVAAGEGPSAAVVTDAIDVGVIGGAKTSRVMAPRRRASRTHTC